MSSREFTGALTVHLGSIFMASDKGATIVLKAMALRWKGVV
jgi:hypothetical protein